MKLITAKTAALEAGVSVPTIHKWSRLGKIETFHAGRVLLVLSDSLTAHLQRRAERVEASA